MPSPSPRRQARVGDAAPTRVGDPLATLPGSDSLRALARRGELRRLRRGTLLISEGDRGDTLFVVVSGRLRAFGSGPDGREVIYGSYGPGEYLGEMGLDGGERSASVEATEASWVVVVTRPTLEQHLHADPPFAFELLAKVIWRARLATQNFKLIALNDVYSRLKAVLEELAPAADGTPRVLDPAPSHQELASRLGCSREMISRVMKDLERGGYVEVGRRRIVLLRTLPAKW
jgi:CRP/FNR family cyclic AMP-dependent transcriptional regulator